MGLKINRESNRHSRSGPESISLQSACYDHLRLVDDDARPVLSIQVAGFSDGKGHLDHDAVKRLFDHIWKCTDADKTPTVVLELFDVQSVDPLFKTELTYFSRQLRQHRRFVRLSGVGLEGDWDSWL